MFSPDRSMLGLLVNLAIVFMSATAKSQSYSSFSDTGVIFGAPVLSDETPNLSFLIESDLHQNEKFEALLLRNEGGTVADELRAPTRALDCSALIILIEESGNSIYFTIDTEQETSFISNICNPNSLNFRGVITVNPLLLENVSGLAIQLASNILAITHTPITYASIKAGRLCRFGYFDIHKKSCIMKRRMESTVYTDYTTCTSDPAVGVPACIINIIAQCSNFDTETFALMVSDLKEWNSEAVANLYGNVYIDICDFTPTNSAILSLLSLPTFLSASYITDFQSILAAGVVASPEQYCSSDGTLPIGIFIEAHEQLLYYLVGLIGATTDPITDADYNAYAYTTDSQLNQLIVNLFIMNQTPGTSLTFSSDITDPGDITVYADMYTGGQVPSCTCTNCVDTVILTEIKIWYQNLGKFAVEWSINPYVSGSVNAAGDYTITAPATPLSSFSLSSSGCYTDFSIPVSIVPSNGWECLNSSKCTVLSSTSTQITFRILEFGLFQFVETCSAGYGRDDYSGCSACISGCTCTDSGTCTGCIATNEFSTSTGCVSCDATCATCSGAGTSACTSCSTNNLLLGASPNSCSTCPSTEYYDAPSQECKTCSEGYFVDGDGCSPCSSHCEICSSSTVCTKCYDPYAVLNDVCASGYRYLQLTDIASIKFDPTFSYIDMTLNVHMVDVSIQHCGTYFPDVSSLGNNPFCFYTSLMNLRIILGSMYTITSSTSLGVIGNLLTTDSSYTAESATFNISPSYPSAPSSPELIMNGPTTISTSCGSSVVYHSNDSTGIARKAFTYSWTINSGASSTLLGSSSTPSVTLQPGSSSETITITLTITNPFGLFSILNTEVDVVASTSILVVLDSSDLNVERQNSQVIQAFAVDRCGYTDGIQYSWTLSGLSVNTNANKLYIKGASLSIGSYSVSVTASMVTTSDGTLTATADVHINIIPSSLVIILDHQGGDISSAGTPLLISGSESYDPDEGTISYSWKTTAGSLLSEATSQASIDITSVAAGTSFDVTLTISGTSSRSISQTVTFRVVDSIITSTLISLPYKKLSTSKIFNLVPQSSIISGQTPSPATISLSQVFGQTTLTLNSVLTGLISMSAGTLQAGLFYTFDLAIAAGGVTANNYVMIQANMGAYCPNAPTTPESLTNTQGEPFTFSILGCYDQDGEDYPLTYAFGYKITSTSNPVRVLTIPSLSPIVYNIMWYQVGTYFGNFRVCDAMNDCASADTDQITIQTSAG